MVFESATRPWGAWHVLDEGEGYKVKRIEVLPGRRLSYQTHELRSEHWYVVAGTATCILDGDTFVVPKATIRAAGARVMDLQDPTRKMSKSEDSPAGTILLLVAVVGAVVLALGAIAHGAVLRAHGLKASACVFAHGAEHLLPGGRRLFDSYHCSRYNTQTKRLTAGMFREVVGRVTARARAARASAGQPCA